MSAIFMVRAQVADPSIREAFDRWYEKEHLPDAMQTFGAKAAWRGWSDADPAVHYAVYEFDDIAQVRALAETEGMKRMVKLFNEAWGEKVVRSRDGVRVVQRKGG